MLRNSFILLDGIARQRELRLWTSGILTWDDFIDEPQIRGISETRKTSMDDDLVVARDRLAVHDSEYFASRIGSRDQWRCLDEFGGSVAYLDIETTGISPRSPITLVGIYDGTRMHTLTRGRDLNGRSLNAILSSVEMIVTFNGASFDLPMIESQYPGSIPVRPHVDLKYPLRRLGHVGGLKAIERELGIERDRRVEYMTGEDAVYLWRLWDKNGNRNALDLLVEYNSEDCRNLASLAKYAYKRLKAASFERAAMK
jgi:uncharacterized protein YprB with RNaseH-like and TPR domain